ncbi:MAG: hypothetical protein JXC36_06725 [Candidatus Atribacteria bacterium]|nr:hypothetical protein [Candidatus Atribacteria bacterium]
MIRNTLCFSLPQKTVQIGLYFKEQSTLKRINKKHFAEFCSDPQLLRKVDEYVWLDLSTTAADAVYSFSLDQIPYLAKWYYETKCYTLLRKQVRIVRYTFTSAIQYWVALPSAPKTDRLLFKKFTLYFDVNHPKHELSITVAYDGVSQVLLTHVEALVNKQQMDTMLLKSVIYNRECMPYHRLPEDLRLQSDQIYPILRKDLAAFLHVDWEHVIDPLKLQTAFVQIQSFYQEFLQSKAMQALFPSKIEWQGVRKEDIFSLKEKSKDLAFGRNHFSKDIYGAFKTYGPYRLPASRHYKVFILYPKERRTIKELLEKHLRGEAGYTSLQSYSHLPLVYRPELNLEISRVEELEKEVETYLARFQKEEGVRYFVFYLSPYPKFGGTKASRKTYYRVKELLLKRQIVSQVISNHQLKRNINFWIPNIAISMLAKLGGTPWKLARTTQKELIVGFGAFRSTNRKKPYVGSSFCFDNEGQFQEFDCWQEVYEWAFMGQLYKAIERYRSKNQSIHRIVIHYYKELNKKEFRQVEELLDQFQLDLPVIVVRISSSFDQKELIVDLEHPNYLPLNATYYHLDYHDYLLYINDREEGKQKTRKTPFPLKVSLQANKIGLMDDQGLVQSLMQQLYDFSLLHWRSINQPRLPVTIAYPHYLAQIFPYFQSDTLQEIGRTSLWFL